MTDHEKLCAAEAARLGNEKVEAEAWAARCPRHRPHLRACAWINDAPCACKAATIANEEA